MGHYICASFFAFALLFFPDVCLAHRVNVFAFVDGDAIQVEAFFSRSRKVENGDLLISDLVTGRTLLEAATNEQGVFRFRPDVEFLKTGHGLNVLLMAGEGHQNTWQLSSEDLKALSSFDPPAKSAPEPTSLVQEQAQCFAANQTAVSTTVTAAELEVLMEKMLDAKLAPIKQMLARQELREPGLRDIIGGIGWIIGFLGLASYMKYKP